MKRFVPRLTYANVVATIALFIALGGASYAALKLPKNSVGTKQIKNKAVTGAKLKDGAVSQAKLAAGAVGTDQIAKGAVTGASVAPDSLTASNIALATLNIPGRVKVVERSAFVEGTVPDGSAESATAKCLAGETVVGGGAGSSNGTTNLRESVPIGGSSVQGWRADFENHTGAPLNFQVIARALCLSQ